MLNINLRLLVLVVTLTAPTILHAQTFDAISHPPHRASEVDVWRIDRPEVRKAHTDYPQIRFSAGEILTIRAGGCVQTGGSGLTWKSYVHPSGSDAAALYSGTLFVPGVVGGPSERIAGVIGKAWTVPENLPPTVNSQLFLHLGYQDDKYSDNGYYKHDDGNNNQCKNVGDAFVEIHIGKPSTHTSFGPVWSPHSKPFDLVWDVNAGVDANGLPLNPLWAYQLDHPDQKPDFEATCGSGIVGGETIDSGKLAATCSSQAPSTDLVDPLIPFLCPGDPLRGHLNWTLATYSGTIDWDEWSGNFAVEDDDFNFKLNVTGDHGLTSTSPDLGLEFNAGESIDSFTNPWWVAIRNDVETLGNDFSQGSDSVAHNHVDGKLAVVTGLFGLDCVHGCYTEIHPAYALAIRSAQQSASGASDETWNFFIRNSGNEGNCSQFWHDWPGLEGMYYIQLPWPKGAKSVTLASGDANVTPFGAAAGSGMTLEQEPGWTYLAFRLPDAGFAAGYDGQVTLRYAVAATQARPVPNLSTSRPASPPPTPPAGPVTRKIPNPEEHLGMRAIEAHLDPATRTHFEQLNHATPSPWHAKFPAHTLTVNLNPAIIPHIPQAGPGKRGELTRDRTRPDPTRAAAIASVEQQLIKATPLNVEALKKQEPKAAPR